GLGAGAVSASLGMAAGWAAAPVRGLRHIVLAASFFFIAMPASLTALGTLVFFTKLPSIFDLVTRSGCAVAIANGIRFAALVTVLCLLAACRFPKSQGDAAQLHAVPLWKWIWHVVLPHMRSTLTACILLAALLSVAEVSTTLLLQPPGQATFST